MVLVFILLGIMILILLLSFLVLLSTLHIEIRDLEASNINKSESSKKARLCNYFISIFRQ